MQTSKQRSLSAWYNYRQKLIFILLLGNIIILLGLLLNHRYDLRSAQNKADSHYSFDTGFNSSRQDVEQSLLAVDSFAAQNEYVTTFNYGQSMGIFHAQKRLDDYTSKKVHKENAGSSIEQPSDVSVAVLLKEQNKIEKVTLDQYVLGVALAEIPLSFEYEAIKAQMIVARTYILHKLKNNQVIDGEVKEFDVTDQVADQVYLSLDEVKKYRQDSKKRENLEKFERALNETKEMFITYEGEPIDAVFFSTSNGYTESSENYWGTEVPYLRSVSSKWDVEFSPSYKQQQTFTYSYINETFNNDRSNKQQKKPVLKIEDRTKSNRIATITINGQRYTGREIREMLGLASNHFTWKLDDKKQEITFTTYGYGHGVGLSQWGANGMAAEGYSAFDIIQHYYTGVQIQQASKLVKN